MFCYVNEGRVKEKADCCFEHSSATAAGGEGRATFRIFKSSQVVGAQQQPPGLTPLRQLDNSPSRGYAATAVKHQREPRAISRPVRFQACCAAVLKFVKAIKLPLRIF
jgi:hypothetical protein